MVEAFPPAKTLAYYEAAIRHVKRKNGITE
ncbi:hypothetical protein AGR5A_Cc90336 [Agrobacterium genomosp. 5 str. CFBP 6626]|nr:hypothetical protein AGR5A_Cc90336 [Agrobacterium genomosp. 5 str. CFBP 6626]